MSISNVSAKQALSMEKASNQNKATLPEAFHHVMQEEMTALKANARPLSGTKPFPANMTSLPGEESTVSSADHDRHIDAFVHQALAHAPESEREIWARMKEELGI